MLIIAGLGNPGRQYEGTRHNVGFCAIDAIAQEYGIKVNKRRHGALTGKGFISGQKVILAKPQTYMNRSGVCIKRLVDWYRTDTKRSLIVIYDDVNLEVGQLRIREKGNAGGHNGVKSILTWIGTEDFLRIRIGVGEKPDKESLADYVLGYFCSEERPVMQQAYQKAVCATGMMASGDIVAAMNQYNRKKKDEVG